MPLSTAAERSFPTYDSFTSSDTADIDPTYVEKVKAHPPEEKDVDRGGRVKHQRRNEERNIPIATMLTLLRSKSHKADITVEASK
jgi:hypothetical protein